MKYFKTEKEASFNEQVVLDLLFGKGGEKEDPLDCLLDEYRGSVKVFIDKALRAERDLHLGYDPYERGIGKPDSRNGYYERDLESVFGLLEEPKDTSHQEEHIPDEVHRQVQEKAEAGGDSHQGDVRSRSLHQEDRGGTNSASRHRAVCHNGLKHCEVAG